MTDEKVDDPEATTEQNIFEQNEGVDWILAWLVGLAERGLEISITLTVGGKLISGHIIGGRKFFDGLAELTKGASANEAGYQEVMAENFLSWQEVYPKSEDIPKDHVPHPAFIHLSNANVQLGNNFVKANFWRGKLTSVDGFMIGAMSG